MSGNFETISMEELKELLGQQAMQDFQNLRQVMLLLNQSGLLAQKGDHLQLSPKGVRRIGQLALRDIYQGLLKDRAGSHLTDHRGISRDAARGDQALRVTAIRSISTWSGRSSMR